MINIRSLLGGNRLYKAFTNYTLIFLTGIATVSCVDTRTVSVPGKDVVSQAAARTLVISTRMENPSFDETQITPTRFTATGNLDEIRQFSEGILVKNLGEALHPDSSVVAILTSPQSLADHIAINDTSETSRAKDFTYQYSLQFEDIGAGQTGIKIDVIPVDKNAIRKFIRESNPTAVYSTISILRYWFIKDFDFERFTLVNAYAPASFEGPAEEVGLVEVTDSWRRYANEEPTFNEEDLALVSDKSDIRAAQEKLNELDYSAGKADGKIGPKTREAISQFQKDMGIDPSGNLNNKTYSSLMEIGM